MREHAEAARRLALTLVLAALGAAACLLIGTPLPWLIGPLLVAAAASLRSARLAGDVALRSVGQWVIGTALGLYFTPQVVGFVASHGSAIAAGIVWALLLGAAFGAFLRWANPQLAGIDRATVFFSSAIGGAAEMSTLAERHGGRMDLVAAAHTVRILLVVVIVPFGFQWAGLQGVDATLPGTEQVQLGGLAALLALTGLGCWLLLRRHVPNAWMLGPLAVAAALTASGIELSALPKWMTNAGQLCIGVSLGARFTPGFVHSAPRWLATVALGTLGMIVLSAGYAWGIARFTGLHPATLLLGTSPGGIAEMCITAKVLQLGVPIVTAFHVTRMSAVVLLAGPLFRWTRAA
jgi:membrane AbrB-like protein